MKSSPKYHTIRPEVPLPRALLWSRDPEPFHPSWNMPIAEFQTKTGCFIPLKLHWKTTHQPLKAWYSAMEVYCGTRDLPASLAVLCSHTLSSSCLLHSQLCSKTHRKTFKYSALATLRIQIPASNSRSKQSLRIGTLACRTCHKSQSSFAEGKSERWNYPMKTSLSKRVGASLRDPNTSGSLKHMQSQCMNHVLNQSPVETRKEKGFGVNPNLLSHGEGWVLPQKGRQAFTWHVKQGNVGKTKKNSGTPHSEFQLAAFALHLYPSARTSSLSRLFDNQRKQRQEWAVGCSYQEW